MGYVDSNGLKLLKQQIENMIEAVNAASIIGVDSNNAGIDLTVDENGVLSADLKLISSGRGGLGINSNNEVYVKRGQGININYDGEIVALLGRGLGFDNNGGVYISSVPKAIERADSINGNGFIGGVIPDGETITMDSNGVISTQVAGATTLGGLYANFDSSTGTLTLSQEPITGSTTS